MENNIFSPEMKTLWDQYVEQVAEWRKIARQINHSPYRDETQRIVVVDIIRELQETTKMMHDYWKPRYESVQYNNSVSTDRCHICGYCKHFKTRERLCKNESLTRSKVIGSTTLYSNEYTKYGGRNHEFLKTCPNRTACRHFVFDSDKFDIEWYLFEDAEDNA